MRIGRGSAFKWSPTRPCARVSKVDESQLLDLRRDALPNADVAPGRGRVRARAGRRHRSQGVTQSVGPCAVRSSRCPYMHVPAVWAEKAECTGGMPEREADPQPFPAPPRRHTRTPRDVGGPERQTADVEPKRGGRLACAPRTPPPVPRPRRHRGPPRCRRPRPDHDPRVPSESVTLLQRSHPHGRPRAPATAAPLRRMAKLEGLREAISGRRAA